MDSNLSSVVYGSLILIGLVVIGVYVLYNLGFFNVSGADYDGAGIAKGFDRIKQPATATYVNRSFKTRFINHYNTGIRIKNISLHEYISNMDCLIENRPYPTQIVDAGNVFNVSAICPNKSDGEQYEMEIALNYSVLNGGTETDYTDSGLVRAQAQPD